MNKEDFETLIMLKNYFKENCSDLVFSNETVLEGNNNAKMYHVNVDAITEKNNYKKIFQEYLVLFIRSYEKLRYMDLDGNLSSETLLEYGKNTWNNKGLIITSKLMSSGIFGELFNDFYINIVKDENILITYSTKRGFGEKNIKGVDVVGCMLEDDNFTFIFSESKFVGSASYAKESLKDDINGKKTEASHITDEYINKFSEFMLDKSHSLYNDESKKTTKIINTIDLINRKRYANEKLIDIFNELNIKIRFVFFAIYTDTKFKASERETYYNEILHDFNNQIKKTGLKKYDIEIVFIPIINKSTEIKEYMSKWD